MKSFDFNDKKVFCENEKNIKYEPTKKDIMLSYNQRLLQR